MDRSLRRSADAALEDESGDGGSFVEKVVVGKVAEPEMLPPNGLLFASMPIENIGQNPAGVLFVRAIDRIDRDVAREAHDKRVDLLLPFADVFAGLAWLQRGTINGVACRNLLIA